MNAKEIDVLKRQIRGEIDGWMAPPEELEIIAKAVKNAEALLAELDAYDEVGQSLMAWYYRKYREQQAAKTKTARK